jgi:hypothetical protein
MSSGSSIDFVPVREIIAESGSSDPAMVVLRRGGFLSFLRLTGVSFHMKSEPEQAAILGGFGAFLNSLSSDAPVQMFMHKRRIDPEEYIRGYDLRLQDPEVPPVLRNLIQDHLQHFRELARDRNLLRRDDYLVLSYGIPTEEVGDRAIDTMPFAGFARRLIGSAAAAAQDVKIDRTQVMLARQQLNLRVRQAIAYFEGIGVRVEMVGAVELETLLFEVFNPGLAERQRARALGAGERIRVLAGTEEEYGFRRAPRLPGAGSS